MKIQKSKLSNAPECVQKTVETFIKELIDKKWLSGNTTDPTNTIFYYLENEVVISFLTFTNFYGEISVTGAWTHPDYRRKKYYSKLWTQLKRYCKRNNFSEIHSGYHFENEVSKYMQKKQKRRIKYTCFNMVATVYEIDK